jgi:hypothetical protein
MGRGAVVEADAAAGHSYVSIILNEPGKCVELHTFPAFLYLSGQEAHLITCAFHQTALSFDGRINTIYCVYILIFAVYIL